MCTRLNFIRHILDARDACATKLLLKGCRRATTAQIQCNGGRDSCSLEPVPGSVLSMMLLQDSRDGLLKAIHNLFLIIGSFQFAISD
jgi:hypothetical protein